MSDEPQTSGRLKEMFQAPSKRMRGALLAFTAIMFGFTAFLLAPFDYLIYTPGPTINVLGSQGETVILEFSDPDDPSLPSRREAIEGDGQLRMVTVSETGGPGSGKVRGGDLLKAWLSKGASIKRYDQVYSRDTTAQEVEEASSAQMTSSHSTAAIAALDYLGIPMSSELEIVAAAPGSGAEGQVEDGDILVSIQDPQGVVHVVDRPSVPFEVVKTIDPGSTVQVTVLRDGTEVTVPIITTGPAEGESFEGSKMGIYLDARTELPIDVTIHLERIGGPSAGLVFALGIIDELTEGGTTGGQNIAATGALSFAGDVIPIGGVKQKMYGAVRDGSKWFLVPTDNCASVVGNEPKGLRVIPVDTLREAVGVVNAISEGNTQDLRSCEAQL